MSGFNSDEQCCKATVYSKLIFLCILSWYQNMFEIKAVFELFILWYVPIIFVVFWRQLSFIKAICIVGTISDPYKSTLLHMQKSKRPPPPDQWLLLKTWKLTLSHQDYLPKTVNQTRICSNTTARTSYPHIPHDLGLQQLL